MRFCTITGTSLTPSVIGLGTADFGTALDKETSFALLDRYVELGGNLIDTAHVYGAWVPGGDGASETLIGHWLQERGVRDRVLLSTKGAHPPMSDFSQKRLDAESIRSDLNESLERLQTDVIDIYWVHRDDPARSVESIMDALHEQVSSGRVRYIGASNWTSERIDSANRYARENGLTSFIGSQPHWNLAALNPVLPGDLIALDEHERQWYADSSDIAVFAYSSQASGFFSGRYSRAQKPEGGRADSVGSMYANEESYKRLDRVQSLAANLGVTGSQIALAFLTSQPFPVVALIGANKLAYLEDSCQAGDLVLSSEQLRYLETGQ
ncbi:aldo/keto reductase [Paenibacillus sp. OV219]|uniref:aldo/keto reductase n=1 Tax=Paenibacillus sp. OV219 TaxID=1884377 RepID=UPI0008C9172C|nr:aldo/keto reductase [Paenibacillus sp. OV219]SEO75909.1 Predicted oxidoreductase [Paenibacillus sp. OV219]